MLPFIVSDTADPLQPIRTLAVALAAGVILGSQRAELVTRRVDARSFALLAALVVWSAAAASASHPASSIFGVHMRFQGMVSLLALVAIGVAGFALPGRVARAALRVLAIAGALVGALIVLQTSTGLTWPALFGNRVIAGAWLAVCVSVASACWLTESGRTRVLFGVVAGVGAVALGAAGSRGAWIAVACGIATLVWAAPAAKRRLGMMGAAAVIALVVAGSLAGGPASSDKLSAISLGSGSTASRAAIWEATASMIADHPLFGVGVGRYIYEYPAYQLPSHARLEREVRADQAHSLPLHTAAESGLPAAIVALALGALVLGAGAVATRAKDGVGLIALAGFAAYAGQAMFGVAAIEPDALGWFLGGVALARVGAVGGRTGGGGEWKQLPGVIVWVLGIVLALGATVAGGWYLRADASHARSVASYYSGQFEQAVGHSESAVGTVGTVDMYRIGLADAALYGGPEDRERALSVVEDGLLLEPHSYDLAVARARLLSASGASPAAVADAWSAAVELWPLGVRVRLDSADAQEKAGRSTSASTLRAEVDRLLSAESSTDE